jgi:hypothetical protein
MAPNDFFELFSASEALKSYDMSIEEIAAGQVDGGQDGGIDCVYIFANGDPLEEDALARRPPPDTALELHIFQCKDSESFQGTAIDKLTSTISSIFDLSRSVEDLRSTYNEQLLARAKLFRDYYSKNISSVQRLKVSIKYFSRSEHVHPALHEQEKTLRLAASRLFPGADVDFSFVQAADLLGIAQAPPQRWMELPLRDSPLVVRDLGYIALVPLEEYARFMLDENGNRRRTLFIENVREYEGQVAVNRAIADTLSRPEVAEDFWMLNNGVTIVADAARQGYKVISLRDPKIVNGLQTSIELLRYHRSRLERDDNGALDERSVLVRVVIPKSERSRDRIIVATNNQTPIPAGVLKATDQIHKNIETYLENHGLYYERQRNSYKNDGRSVDSIVTMPHLARCMVSVLLGQPHLAVKINAQRKLLTSPALYKSMFNEDIPLPTYLAALRVMSQVRDITNAENMEAYEDHYMGRRQGAKLWWLHWHLGLYLTVATLGRIPATPSELATIDLDKMRNIPPQAAIHDVRAALNEIRNRLGGKRTAYQVAKQPSSVDPVVDVAVARSGTSASSS